jgi:hypothetical protein
LIEGSPWGSPFYWWNIKFENPEPFFKKVKPILQKRIYTIEKNPQRTKAKANTRTNYINHGDIKQKKRTTTYINKKVHDNELLIPTKESTETLTNEATHAVEQGELNSNEEYTNYYNKDDPNNTHLTGGGKTGATCTEAAKKNEDTAGQEWVNGSEGNDEYESMTDEELDALMFNYEDEEKKEEE